jgi:2,3-bisphosphoglycerate-independent phosphoglycerate mutase
MRHLKSLLQITKKHLESHNVSAFIHAITDGRDTAPRSAKTFLIDDLVPFLEEEGFAQLGSVCGRYYAMDRDKREERTQLAYDAITTESISIENLSTVKFTQKQSKLINYSR